MLGLYRQNKFEDWPFRGDARAAKELLDAVSQSGQELNQYHAYWQQRSGVAVNSAVAHEHRLGFDYLQLFLCFDQLDASNVAGLEALCRRLLIIQKAVRRNPKVPDFTGFERFLITAVDDLGGVVATGFDEWMASEQKSEALILKQSRLWNEEQSAENKRQTNRGNTGHPNRVRPNNNNNNNNNKEGE